MIITVDKLARVKRVLDEINVEDIPVGDTAENLANAFVIGLLGKKSVFNDFFTAITDDKKDYYGMETTEVIGIATDFFTNTTEQLTGLIKTMLSERKLRYVRELEQVKNLQMKAMIEAVAKIKSTDTSTSQLLSAKTE